MSHTDLVKSLGKPLEIATQLSKLSGRKLDRESVYKWNVNGVPWRWRPFVAKMAKAKGVKLPKDFLPGVAA